MKRLYLCCLLLICGFAQGREVHELAAEGNTQQTLTIWGVANYDAIYPVLTGMLARRPDLAIEYSEFNTLELYHAILDLPPHQPAPDIVMSSAMDLQFKLVNDGYAQGYSSDIVEALPDWTVWRDEVFAFTFEPMVMVINRDILGNNILPESREQLLTLIRNQSPLVQGKIGVSDIERVGLGYLAWFHDSQQSRTYGRLLEAFGSHHARLYENSSAMLQALLKGEIFIAYNVLGSYAMAWSRQYPWIETVMPTDYTSVIMRTAFIHKDARHVESAQHFLDYLLSTDGQNVMAQGSSLIPISNNAVGHNSLTEVRRKTHGIFRPIPFGLPLLVQTDQAKRTLLIEEWRNAMYDSGEN